MEKPCATMVDTFESLMALRRAGKTGHEMRAAIAEGLLHIVKVKDLLRSRFNRLEELREGTAAAKSRLDTTNLQLQNQLYERNYYVKEIKACHSFKSKYTEDDIDLVPEEEFLASTAGQYKDLVQDPHKLMVERLNHERAKRVELLAKLEAVKADKEAADAAAAAERKLLAGLQAELQKLGEAAKPLRDQLGLQPTARASLQTASLLPQPLYLIYAQLSAAGEAYGLPIAVSLIGSIAEAQNLARIAASRVAGIDLGTAAGDGERPKKRARYGIDTTDLPVADVPAVHPLAVGLRVGSASAPLITVRFMYALAQQMVTVQAVDPADNAVLASLYPGDDGSTLPSEAAALVAGGAPPLGPSRVDRPYRWAQRLGGVDLFPLVQPTHEGGAAGQANPVDDILPILRKQQRALALVELLRTAKPSNIALRSQLESLQRLKPMLALPNAMFPDAGPAAALHSWVYVPPAPAPAAPGSRAAKGDVKSDVAADAPAAMDEESSDEEGMVKDDDEDPTTLTLGNGEAIGVEEQTLGSKRFMVQLRMKALELLAVVVVPATYPRQASRVSLTELRRLPQDPRATALPPRLTDKERILALVAGWEATVNEQLLARVPQEEEDQLLAYQIAGLMHLFGGNKL